MFRPFDMTDDEFQERIEVRDKIPPLLRSPLIAWACNQVADESTYATESRIHDLQSALQVPLEADDFYTAADAVVGQFEDLGDRHLLWLIDYLLSEFHAEQGTQPIPVSDLRRHMDQTRSSLTVAARDGEYRLTHRLPEGVEEQLVAAVGHSNTAAGTHLINAIREATTLNGKPSIVMVEDIRAIEAAAGPVVTPKDRRPRLSKIVAALKANQEWSLNLQRRDDGVPDHRATLIGMLETLAFAQQDRHTGTAPTPEQAQAHMLLTATLVGWFSTGVVRMS